MESMVTVEVKSLNQKSIAVYVTHCVTRDQKLIQNINASPPTVLLTSSFERTAPGVIESRNSSRISFAKLQ
jgi:hypothetical protein